MDSLEALRRGNYDKILGSIVGHFSGAEVIKGLFPQDFSIERRYDFIIFNDVFEHIPDLDAVLRKCRELLKPEGLLIINCPDSNGIFFRVVDFYSPHLWYFNRENRIAGYAVYLGVLAVSPFLNLLPKDIMCLFITHY